VAVIKENIYGHFKRLQWIISHITEANTIVELGCGTGSMISLPLTEMGYSVYGLDTDKNSIAFGQQLFQKEGFDPENLKLMDLSELHLAPDVIIASEVLEHMHGNDLVKTLSIMREKLKPEGLLLVTVPNGYGWFEMESFVWFETGIGQLLERLRIVSSIWQLKCLILGKDIQSLYPSTLCNSSHRQRFTYHSIIKLLEDNGFEVIESKGSVLFAGPFSNLFFTGIRTVTKINCALGYWFPQFASGFYISCRVKRNG
jgi:2-polyprenyl-3-methyl-5-hydroxy-6-metoxy-1,4-benzoquinol methylase